MDEPRSRRLLRTRVVAMAVLGAIAGVVVILSLRADVDAIDPAERTVGVQTESCGSTAGSVGTGVAIGAELVATAAHIALPGGDVTVTDPSGRSMTGRVVALDTETDLALIRVHELDVAEVDLVELVDGTEIAAVGAVSGRVEGEAVRPVRITIEEVGGTSTVERDGYEIRAELQKGDSGGGVFDGDGGLGGIVFAISRTEASVTWVTASSELARLIADGDKSLNCDPGRGRLVAQ